MNHNAAQSITLFNQLVQKDSLIESEIEGVFLFRSSKTISQTSLHYEQCLLFVLQGEKQLFFNGLSHAYNADNYVILTTPMTLAFSQTASTQCPVLMIGVRIDISLISQLTGELMTHTPPGRFIATANSGLLINHTTGEIKDIIHRLLKALHHPPDAQLLGKAILRELLYRVLLNDTSNALFALVQNNTNLAKVAAVIQYMSHHYEQKMDVQSLAAQVNMSVPSLHRVFKEITATSPKQYLKLLRLHKAKALLENRSMKVSQAANAVGYESSTQFSREFSRLFGVSPGSLKTK